MTGYQEYLRQLLLETDSAISMLRDETRYGVLPNRVRTALLIDLRRQKYYLNSYFRDLANSLLAPSIVESLPTAIADCRALLIDVHEIDVGVATRQLGLDMGLCRIADALLQELSDATGVPWDRVTLVSDHEYVDTRARLVRLRLSDLSVWNLPIAAHEFGHTVIENLIKRWVDGSIRQPVLQVIGRYSGGDSRQRLHLSEYAADIFATYTLGPAYVCCCVMNRFVPSRAHMESKSHPSEYNRMRVMMQVLRYYPKEDTIFLGETVDSLDQLWEHMLQGNMVDAMFYQNQNPLPTRVIQELLELFESHLAVESRYRDTDYGNTISIALKYSEANRKVTYNPTIRDVLNAAWALRIRLHTQGEQLDGVGSRAKEMCELIAAGINS